MLVGIWSHLTPLRGGSWGSGGNPIPGFFRGNLMQTSMEDGLPAPLEYALGTTDTHPESGPSSMSAHFAAGKAANFEFLRQIDADEVSGLGRTLQKPVGRTISKRIAAELQWNNPARHGSPDPADEPLFCD